MKNTKNIAVAFLLMASLGGCASGGQTVEVDAGQFSARDRNEIGPGDPHAFKRLATELSNNADAGTVIVHWQNGLPSGFTSDRTITYSRADGTLSEHGSKGIPINYSGVTDAAIQAIAADGGRVDDLEDHGASRS